MKLNLNLKRFFAFAVLGLMIFSSVAVAANVEDALSPRQDDSVYILLKLENTSGFLKWAFSHENIDIFMPLILASKESNEILGGIEVISSFVEKTPLKSAAIIAGMNKAQVPFFQMVFTVDSELEPVVKKIADGTATASDMAKILLGNNSPLASLAESMIKVERGNDNILRVDNELFIKAYENLILVSVSESEVKTAINVLENPGTGLFGKLPRKFATHDFALFHMDQETAKKINDDEDMPDLNEYFDKPLNVELGFERIPDKFTLSMAINITEALKKEYAEKIKTAEPSDGGYIKLSGLSAPLAALGGVIDISPVKENKDAKEIWDSSLRQLKNRFGITEEDVLNLFKGAFSISVNDSVMFENFKIPAVYISQTGIKGAAEKLYEKLAKSPHFQKVRDGVLQIDSSISPISCLIEDKGETIGINFADLANLSGTPSVKPALNELMNKKATSAMWIDFAGIQAWFNDDENGILAVTAPMARLMGYGDIFDAVRDVLGAKFSVPSMSFWSESSEVFYMDFAVVDVKPEDCLTSKLVKIARKFIDLEKTEEKSEEKTPEK